MCIYPKKSEHLTTNCNSLTSSTITTSSPGNNGFNISSVGALDLLRNDSWECGCPDTRVTNPLIKSSLIQRRGETWTVFCQASANSFRYITHIFSSLITRRSHKLKLMLESTITLSVHIVK